MKPYTYEELKAEFRLGYSGDPWGHVLGWLFAIADEMETNRNGAPVEWEFRQSPMGPDEESYEYCVLQQAPPSDNDLERFGNLLWRYRAKLKHLGKDY